MVLGYPYVDQAFLTWQYEILMFRNPSLVSPKSRDGALRRENTGLHPVESVSWFDAVDFCIKLSAQEKLPPFYTRKRDTVTVLGGNGYRLPTEAEWEYACRAGTTTRWSFGDDEKNLAQHVWFKSNSLGRTHPVGTKAPNAYGLHDMHGNVYELCSDGKRLYTLADVSDPAGPASASHRMLPGGAFSLDPPNVRSAFRNWVIPSSPSVVIGFRVARNDP
jgi:formylglycine-generating enzyme required for sulfatase activity